MKGELPYCISTPVWAWAGVDVEGAPFHGGVGGGAAPKNEGMYAALV